MLYYLLATEKHSYVVAELPVKLLILCCFVLLNALAGKEKAVTLLPHTTVAGETKGVLDVYLL